MDLFAGNIKEVEIEEEMKSAYIDYAMSVLVGRALPDVRDGLKPVHRRILFTMHDQGNLPNKPHRKSARIVGDVMGKYHPHGDASLYEAMVKMAQDFSTRYPLVDGHGNFGSIDGDNAAAMRYTETRLSSIATELLRDIEKETVRFVQNYDDTLQEPVVLPAKYPNLLANGSSGIAVGLSTNIPPHNLGEIIDASIMVADNPDIEIEELLRTVKGPDFPTGGTIVGMEGIRKSFLTGKGSVRVRGKAHVETTKNDKKRIIVTEIPYQVKKSAMIERIAETVRGKKIPEISDIRDESDRNGIRVVIELKRDAVPKIVINKLFKNTQLENVFNVQMIALVDNTPRLLNLKQILEEYIKHQKVVIRKRTEFDLKKAQERDHILEGLIKALDSIEMTIKIIRSSKDTAEAKEGLREKLEITERQAQAILEMRLQRLTALEQGKLRDERAELLKKMKELKEILENQEVLMAIIKKEMQEIKEKYADERRTDITPDEDEIIQEDIIADEDVVVLITHSGYIKRLPLSTYRMQNRGGVGVSGVNLKDEDFVEHLFIATNHQYLHFFSNKGNVYRKRVYETPESSRTARGQALVNILPLEEGEKIQDIINIREYKDDLDIMMATKKGMIKKTALTEYDTQRKGAIKAIVLREGDELVKTRLTGENKNVILITKNGKGIKFNQSDVRRVGRVSSGVKGITLSEGDGVVTMGICEDDDDIFCITEKGYGKRSASTDFSLQRRGGKGVKAMQIIEKKGKIAGAMVVKASYELVVARRDGVVIRMQMERIPRIGRSTQGVKVISLKGEETVAAIAKLMTEE